MFFAETLTKESHVAMEWLLPIGATLAAAFSVAYSPSLFSKPELVTSIFPAPNVFANPSAICDRAEFFLQTNITRFILFLLKVLVFKISKIIR